MTVDPIPQENEYNFFDIDARGLYVAQFYALNTEIEFACAGEKEHIERIYQIGVSALRHFERLFSRTLPHSDISRINAAQGKTVPIALETYDLLRHAIQYCENSHGTFDITIAPIVELYRPYPASIPSKEQLNKVLPTVDWKGIKLSHQIENERLICFAQLSNPRAKLDVGGIAKGWIADRLKELFLAQGISCFSLSLGGNMVVGSSKPNGDDWFIALQDPLNPQDSLGNLKLSNVSIVSSGTYERFIEYEGKTYHHILNPKTGFPTETDLLMATVLSEKSLDAEGYSTTLLALGLEKAMEFAKQQSEILQAFFVDRHNTLHELYPS